MRLCFSKIHMFEKFKKQKPLKNQENIRNEPIKIYHRFLRNKILVLQQETKYALVSWDDLAN